MIYIKTYFDEAVQIVLKLTTEAGSREARVVGRGKWYNSVHCPAPVCTMYPSSDCTSPLVVTVPCIVRLYRVLYNCTGPLEAV